MNLIKHVGVSEERVATGIGAKINRPAAVYDAREIGRIGLTEDPSAECDEARMVFFFLGRGLHNRRVRERFLHRLYFRDEDLERTDGQSIGQFCRFQSFGAGEQDLKLMPFDASCAREIQLEFFL